LDPLTEIGGQLRRALGLDSYFDGAGLTPDALPAVRQFLPCGSGQSAYTGVRKTISLRLSL
jgi:hypothetical protein